MSSVRTSRIRLLTAAATVALATLSLTACNDGSGVQTESASAGASSLASPPASNAPGSVPSSDDDAKSASAGSKQTADAPAASKNDKAGTGNSGTTAGQAVTCQGSNTKTVAAPLKRPVNHMLLTVTNTGSKRCFLYGYPAVRFGEAQSVPPVIEDSKPQAVVTLEPGDSGYASVSLSATDGSGSHGRTEKSLAVYFHGRSGNESVGTGAHPALPAKGVHIDDSLKVTYWQQSMDDAIMW
ncbi:DUF4232 domain-containing protein [Streptomyces sp. CA-132043]|uniref:DUF4232 domain-containing protein n=1 Tax=Streptomyces sp. CA-132043 TaxID=3240048 RepID=UPI003D91FAE4